MTFSNPSYTTQSLVTSGIAQRAGVSGVVGLIVDQDFDIADGIRAKLGPYTNHYNFGVTRILFGGSQYDNQCFRPSG